MKLEAIRLLPGADLRQSLLQYSADREIDAACIVSCVGSLDGARLRFAGAVEGAQIAGKLEILSLNGTLSRHGCHLHIAVAEGDGRVSGGHLLDGSPVYTTVEVVLAALPDLVFKRVKDESTGYRELQIEATKADHS
jgi:predicted DNA-binding protein with PD1-like motif